VTRRLDPRAGDGDRGAAVGGDIAAGGIEVDIERLTQPDEIGSLTDAFADMGAYLTTVSKQANALAQQDFDDPVIGEDVPGSFGESLQLMSASLDDYTDELETMTEQLKRRSKRLQDLVAAFGDAAQRTREGDLTATIDEEMYRDVVADYNDLVETLASTIGDVQAFADDISGASNEVATSMTEVDNASDGVARSVQEILDGAAEQTRRLQTVAEEMSTLSATVEEIAAWPTKSPRPHRARPNAVARVARPPALAAVTAPVTASRSSQTKSRGWRRNPRIRRGGF
jgi:methyl-accepting chemotaxis protein